MEGVAKPKAKTRAASAPVTDVVVKEAGNVKVDNVVKYDAEQVRSLAVRFGLDMDMPLEQRMDRAVRHLSTSAQYMLAAGIDLLSLREECAHGEFLKMLEEQGVEERAAYRAIQYTQFLLSRSESERDKLLGLPKSHVLAIASADPEVIDDLLQSDDKELAGLSVRELRTTIKDLSARKTDIAVQLEKSELEVERLNGIVKQLREARVKTGGDVPVPVQDMRLECAALYKKAELSVDDMESLIKRFLAEEMEFIDWKDAVARHLVAALSALHARTGGLLSQLGSSFGPAAGVLEITDVFSPEEVLRCGQEYKTLTEEHKHEQTVREWEREMERPAKAGRPKNKPQAGK
ncbi:hypothetical protein [Herbaspirillum lusitanum]|uniref:hypothetical protein n=1 Tax=Herbaspirillum lusitanum TaxID=213312 RepID=UPI0022378713|nr:hypothetical protein [Herbaspirillum lusitanum]